MRLRCPLCRRETEWEDNPWRPFCSQRCHIIDLGAWASDTYRIPVRNEPEPSESPSEDGESS